MEEFYQSCFGCMDPFSSSSTSPHVSLSPRELIFNHKMSSSLLSTSSASSQSVFITNYTRGKLRYDFLPQTGASKYYITNIHILYLCETCLRITLTGFRARPGFSSSLVWTDAQASHFTVSPSSCDLAPLKSTSFRVTYDPKQLNTLHGAQLECFASYKMVQKKYILSIITSKYAFLSLYVKKRCSLKFVYVLPSILMLQDDHHVGERLLCPPWCVTVRVLGHSFPPGKEHFVPCCALKPPQVVRSIIEPLLIFFCVFVFVQLKLHHKLNTEGLW